jgi:hypothetical protein
MEGMDNITVMNGTITNQSQIDILPTSGPLSYIVITPSGPVTLNPTDFQLFTALGYDQFGVLNISWNPTWNTSDSLGIVTPTGGSAVTGWTANYTAGSVVGIDNITVANGTITNRSQIDIIPRPLFRIELTPWPGPLTMNPTGIRSYTAFGYDQFDNLNTTWTPTWGTVNGLGTVTPTGGNASAGWTVNFTAGTVVGMDNITVANGTISNSSQISIIPGPLFEIEFIQWPGPVTLNPTANQSYAALGYDQYGNLNTTWTPVWGTTDSLGTVTSTDTAGSVAGMDNITVTSGTVTNQSTINIISTPPTSSIDSLPEYHTALIFDIAFTATDNSGTGLLEVELWYRHDGGTWTEYGAFDPTSATISFTASADGFYEFYTRARDNAGGYEAAPTTSDTSTTIDTTLPTVSSTSPMNNALDVAINTSFRIEFSESMHRGSVENAFTFTDGVTVWDRSDGTIQWLDDETMVFTPNFNLE